MLTGTADIGSAIRAVNEGRIFHYLTKPVSPDEILTTLQAGMASYHAVRNEQEKLRAAITTVELLDVGTLTALARAIDAKSKWTAGHSERVASLALRLAHVLQVSGRDLQIIHRGSLLHDIGKIGTPAAILDKPHRLTPAEMDIMRDHVAIGVRILEPIPIFRDVLPLVAQHHEWYDGSGYPAGLRGKEIALPARILTVADCFDAIVSDRPYRRGVSPLRAVEILTERAARQFDPDVVRAFGALVSPKS
jgi:putative nucleotidyltransferase with HDIG domain